MATPVRAEADAARGDMELIRRGIATVSERIGVADFDTINAVVTLKRTATDLESFAAGYCKQADLSPGRLNVLMALNASPDKAMALSEIGEYLVVTRPNITGLIDGLVSDGMVKRIDHPDDRRMVLAQLTQVGREFMRTFVPFHHRALNAIMSVMTKQDKRQLVALLDKLRAHLHEVNIPPLEEG
jgi:DNA-binding MarR family transcriptional regulator